MDGLNRSALKLTKILDLNADKIKKLYDIIGLSDMAALTVALNTDDVKTIKAVYDKYASKLVELPSTKEVQNFYHDQIQVNARNEDEALADTADHFGITGEQVQELLGSVQESQARHKDVTCPVCQGEGKRTVDGESKICFDCDGLGDMPYQRFLKFNHKNEAIDPEVLACVENVKEMMQGGKSKKLICELNTWQRRMFYGLVPSVVSKVMQKTIDMTPIALMQKHAKLGGYGESAIVENELSLHEMIEAVIEHRLNALNETNDYDSRDQDPIGCDYCGSTGVEQGDPHAPSKPCKHCNDNEPIDEAEGDSNEEEIIDYFDTIHQAYGIVQAFDKTEQKFNVQRSHIASVTGEEDPEEKDLHNGMKVKLVDPYAGKHAHEIFTLSQWDGERGWIGDKNGRGWSVGSHQIEPAGVDDDYEEEPEHDEDLDAKLKSDWPYEIKDADGDEDLAIRSLAKMYEIPEKLVRSIILGESKLKSALAESILKASKPTNK